MPVHKPASDVSCRIADRAADFVLEGRPLSVEAIAAAVGAEPERVRALYPEDGDLSFAAVEGGFARMEAVMDAVPKGSGDAARLAAMGRAYIDFALTNRALFLLMFDPVHAPRRPDVGRDEGYLSTLEVVADTLWTPSDSEIARIALLQVWSMVHGYAMLAISGSLPDEAVEDHVIDRLLETGVIRIAA